MIERIYSSRINWVTLSQDEAKELRDFYQVQYENALKQATKLLIIDECCLSCGGNPQYVYYLP